MVSTYVIQRHQTGKSHFDLRMIIDEHLRSWSLLKVPPLQPGEHRLAIEREDVSAEHAGQRVVYESAFGSGIVTLWDEGQLEFTKVSPQHILLEFRGRRLSGSYELRRMNWYPGNRWLLKMLSKSGKMS